MEQLTLFQEISVPDLISQIADAVCIELNLGSKFVGVVSSAPDEKSGQILAASLWIREPIELKNSVRIFRIEHAVTAKLNRYYVEINASLCDKIDIPGTATVKKTTIKIKYGDNDFSCKPKFVICFARNDMDNMKLYLTEYAKYVLNNYKPPASNRFGCCGKYIKCSDAKKCLHDNEFYARACWYRGNLENGKIFYGKNKNI